MNLTFKLADQRSKDVVKNVVRSFLVKIISTIVTLSLVPISLGYVDKGSYGVYLTIASVVTWFSIFDFGLVNGLTNRISEALVNDDVKLVRSYLSTTYVFLFFFVIFILSLYFLLDSNLNWNTIFNTKINERSLRLALRLTVISFCLLFLLKPITSLLMVKQLHFIANGIMVAGNFLSLALIYFCGHLFTNSFVFLVAALVFTYPLCLLIYSIIYYIKEPFLRPTIASFKFTYKRKLFGLSIKFFIIQISVIVILTSNNFLIAQFTDNDTVTLYNIAYRYFSIATIFQLMFVHPLWAAFSEAFAKKDFAWIKKIIAQINRLNFFLVLGLVGMLLVNKFAYSVWLGPEIEVPQHINIYLSIYFSLTLFVQAYVHFINGAGTLNLQVLYSLITLMLHYPTAYLLMKVCNFGVDGLLILNIFWAVLALILWKMQYEVIIIRKNLQRIWR